MASEFADSLNAETILLVCQSSLIDMWIDHYSKHYPEYKVFNLMKQKNIDLFLSHVEKKVGVVSYQTAWRRKQLLKLQDFLLICDESSNLQNKQAKQTKGIMKLNPSNIVLLSGTPTSGKYENLWTQARLLGWEISESLYQRQYVNWNTIKIPGGQFVKVVDKANPYKNVDRLKSKLREHGAIFMKTEDVMNLPEQTFVEINISKPKHYDKFMKDSIVTVNGAELVGDTSLTKRLYARELCGIYSAEKLEAFRDLISSTNDRIIVFYNFKHELFELNEIACECDKPVSRIDGDFKNLGAYEENDNSITFVQYAAGAVGLNLQKANKIIYYSLPERSELFEQSKKRIHRIGQEKPCFYYLMICQNTVEVNIYEALKQRKDFTDELFRECEK